VYKWDEAKREMCPWEDGRVENGKES
jgi:hypothetical protein